MKRAFLVFPLLVGASLSQATVLTFDDLGLANYGVIDNAYGNRVTSPNDGIGSYLEGNGWTPNVSIAYYSEQGASNTDHLLYWATNYSNLVSIAFSPYTGGVSSITLTADAGWLVRLNSFDLGAYSNSSLLANVITVTDGDGNVLFDQSNTMVGTTTPVLATSYAPNLVAEQLTITWGSNWNIGIDNIDFDQEAVPEPATLGLLALGALALKRKRK